MLRFHRLVEAAVAPAAASIEGLEYQQRRRSPLLENDLSTLTHEGVVPDPVTPRVWPAPSLLVTGPGAALGCLYVVEGSTLGGRVLARWITGRLGYERHRGASGFAADARGTAQRWRAFGAVVEAWIARAPEDLSPMVASAQATFAVHRAVVAAASPRAEAWPA
jgi:heme oxygenase